MQNNALNNIFYRLEKGRCNTRILSMAFSFGFSVEIIVIEFIYKNKDGREHIRYRDVCLQTCCDKLIRGSLCSVIL